MMFVTGCVSTLSNTTSSGSDQFSVSLEKLEKSGDISALKTLASSEKNSVWSESSRSILNIYTGQQKKIKSLNNKNKSLTEENKKLLGNLDKMNQINLEMEKRSP